MEEVWSELEASKAYQKALKEITQI